MIIVNEEIVKWTTDDMLEIYLNDPEDFLRIRESLTRIGISAKRKKNTLIQSCHILHKRGKYYIMHFKEMFLLDGKPTKFLKNDLARRNTIALLLSDWGLLEIINKDKLTCQADMKQIKVLPFKEKKNWTLISKYTIGSK
jgi:hypothetical protein